MSWRVIFTGATALLVAVLVGFLALAIRNANPWLSNVALFADLGVMLAGLKTVLDTTKTANELRRMDYEFDRLKLEIEKLNLDIKERKETAEKENSRLVAATLDEILKYSRRMPEPRVAPAIPAMGSSVIYAATSVLLVIVSAGIVWKGLLLPEVYAPASSVPAQSKSYSPFPGKPNNGKPAPSNSQPPSEPNEPEPAPNNSRSPGRPSEPTPEPNKSQFPIGPNKSSEPESHSLNSSHDMTLRINQLTGRVLSVDDALNDLQEKSKPAGLLPKDIVAKQASMDDALWRARRADILNDEDLSRSFLHRAEDLAEDLENFLAAQGYTHHEQAKPK